jgi:hypothetical protein
MIIRYILLFTLCSMLNILYFLPSNAHASAEWEVALRVEAGTGYNRLILGADATATDGYDNDWEVYAMLGGKIEAYFPHFDWPMVHQVFWRDIRAKAPGTTTEWSFVVDSPEDENTGKPFLYNYDFTIRWDLSRVPENYAIFLTDDTTAQQMDMRLNTSYSFLFTGYRTFKVAVYVPPEVTPPNPPYGLKGKLSQGGVILSWKRNRERDLAGYNVYRSATPESGYERIASLVSVPKYVDTQVVKGNTYYYLVTAVNTAGGESGYSNKVAVNYRIRSIHKRFR